MRNLSHGSTPDPATQAMAVMRHPRIDEQTHIILLMGAFGGGAGPGSGAWETGRGGSMPSMKVTVSAAMRARDVSRPRPHHEAAAEEDAASARPASSQRARTAPPRGAGPARSSLPAGPPAPPTPRNRPAPPGNRPAGASAPKPGDGVGAAPGTRAAPGMGAAPGAGVGKPGPPRRHGGGPSPASEPPNGARNRERREPVPSP